MRLAELLQPGDVSIRFQASDLSAAASKLLRGVNQIIAAVGVNPDGVLTGRREPRIVIAFVSPEAGREEHLRFLSEAARLSRDPSRVDRIVNAADEGAAIEAMRA